MVTISTYIKPASIHFVLKAPVILYTFSLNLCTYTKHAALNDLTSLQLSYKSVSMTAEMWCKFTLSSLSALPVCYFLMQHAYPLKIPHVF